MTDLAPAPSQLPNPQTTAHRTSWPSDDVLKCAIVTAGVLGAGLIGLFYMNGGSFRLSANGTSASLKVGRRHPTKEANPSDECEQQDDDNPNICRSAHEISAPAVSGPTGAVDNAPRCDVPHPPSSSSTASAHLGDRTEG